MQTLKNENIEKGYRQFLKDIKVKKDTNHQIGLIKKTKMHINIYTGKYKISMPASMMLNFRLNDFQELGSFFINGIDTENELSIIYEICRLDIKHGLFLLYLSIAKNSPAYYKIGNLIKLRNFDFLIDKETWKIIRYKDYFEFLTDSKKNINVFTQGKCNRKLKKSFNRYQEYRKFKYQCNTIMLETTNNYGLSIHLKEQNIFCVIDENLNITLYNGINFKKIKNELKATMDNVIQTFKEILLQKGRFLISEIHNKNSFFVFKLNGNILIYSLNHLNEFKKIIELENEKYLGLRFINKHLYFISDKTLYNLDSNIIKKTNNLVMITHDISNFKKGENLLFDYAEQNKIVYSPMDLPPFKFREYISNLKKVEYFDDIDNYRIILFNDNLFIVKKNSELFSVNNSKKLYKKIIKNISRLKSETIFCILEMKL